MIGCKLYYKEAPINTNIIPIGIVKKPNKISIIFKSDAGFELDTDIPFILPLALYGFRFI